MIQIIEGPSGSGKSRLVYEEIIQMSRKEPEKNFFLIVPEQFTMQAQRDIVSLHPQHGTMNIDIVSFNRLAYRIFEELNIRTDYVLEDFGKSMLLQRILLENRKKLPCFGPCVNKPGFVDELKSLMTELFQYRIGLEDMKQVYAGMTGHNMLKGKLEDLLFVYEAFQKEVKDSYIIAEHVLEMLALHIEESALLKNSILYLDGFTGFTPIQYEVLAALAKTGERMTFTITIDAKSAAAQSCAEHELFYLTKDTINRIKGLGERMQIRVEERFLKETGIRFREAPELQHLEQNLFRFPYQVWQGEVQHIKLQAFATARQELQAAGRQIRAMVREGSYRFRDIAVIHGDLNSLEPMVEEIFPKLNIPYFIDTNQSIYMNPCLEAIRSILDIAQTDYSYESVFRFLKTGVTDLSIEQIEILENYVLRKGLRGLKWWRQVFEQEPAGIGEIGRQVLHMLMPVTEALKEAVRVQEYVKLLQDFLNGLNMEKQLELAGEEYEAQGNLVLAKSYGQIYARLEDIWNKLIEILGDGEMTLEEFRKVLETGLDDITLGVIPPSLDQVTVGDIERTRLNHVKVLFVLGINDGIIPKAAGSSGILSETDRELLGKELELAPNPKNRVFTEQFYLYQNLTKPSKELYLMYHLQDKDGNEALPAYLIGRLQRIFPHLEGKMVSTTALNWNNIETAADSAENLIAALFQEELQEEAAELWKSLCSYYEKNQPERIQRIQAGLLYNNLNAWLSPETAAKLYGLEMHTSVSRLETYSRCPYQFFLQYGLQLKQRERSGVSLSDMGSLLHRIVEGVFTQVENRNAEEMQVTEDAENVWETITDEALEELVEQEMKTAMEEVQEEKFLLSKSSGQLLQRIEKTAAYAVCDLRKQLLRGKMIPYKFELKFPPEEADEAGEDIQSARIELGQGSRLQLKGIIDRIDICQDDEHVYVKVMDYKSSGRDIDVNQVNAGLQLQLLVYTNVVLEVLQKRFPNKQIIPAGSLYYGFQIPMVEKTSRTVGEALENKLQRETALTGVINMEEPCISLLGGTDILPVKVKKEDGELRIQESDTVLTQERYYSLLSEVQQTIAELGKEMADGQIPIRPVQTGRTPPCAYCEYRDVCKLDCQDGGNQIYTIAGQQAVRKGGSENGVDEGTAGNH